MIPETETPEAKKLWILRHLYGYRCKRCRQRFVDFSPRVICRACEKTGTLMANMMRASTGW